MLSPSHTTRQDNKQIENVISTYICQHDAQHQIQLNTFNVIVLMRPICGHLLILCYLSSTLISTDCAPRLARVRYCWAIMKFTPNLLLWCNANTYLDACYRRPKVSIHFFLEQFCPCWHPEQGWIEAKNVQTTPTVRLLVSNLHKK